MAVSHGSNVWAWKNLSSDLESNAAVTAFFHSDVPVECYRDGYYAAAGVIILFRMLSYIFQRRNVGNYNKLAGPAKLVYVTHWAFLWIFTFTAIPYSYATVKVLFGPNGVIDLVQASTFRLLTFPLAFQLCMYIFEGAFRAVLHVNLFLFVHHIIFCTFVVLCFQSESLFMLKVDMIVSCFATYEFLLYAALISRKTTYFYDSFRWLMISGLSFYFITRVVQIVLLLGLFVLGFDAMSHTSRNSALYWVALFMCIALMALQMYTFVIYKAVWDNTLQALPVTDKQATNAREETNSARWQQMSEEPQRSTSDMRISRSISAAPRLGDRFSRGAEVHSHC